MRKNSMYEGLENTQAPEFIERAYAYIQEVAKEYDKNTREDLIQESMLHIIEHKDNWDVSSPSWMAWKLRDVVDRKAESLKEAETIDFDTVPQQSYICSDYDSIEVKSVLEKTFYRMTDNEKNALIKRFYLGMDYEDIAKEFGVNRSRAHRIVDKALYKVRKCYKATDIAY